MGNDSNKPYLNSKRIYDKSEIVNKNSFEYLSIIGKGGFGKVWKVLMHKTQKQYALKEMSKAKIIDKRSENSIKFERDLLSRINHPFIVNMHYAFQDKDNLYIIMDLLTGGDLRYHLCRRKKFTEAQTRFFISCILLGLEYIHLNNVIHRDIKPENLVLDSNGYVKITDFGIAKYYQKDNANETSGTPGYMAPEVMWAKNHTKAVDYFALGIIGYEFMKGVRPYLGSRKEIKEKIMTKQAQITKTDIPNDWPLEAAHFINSLIQRKASKRLGYKGVSEIKEHSWLKYYPWRDLYLGKVNSPFKPSSNDNYDQRYCNKPDRIGFATQERYENILENTEYNVVFKDFLYFNREVEEKAYQQHDASEYKVKTFKNPHYLYYEELTGNTESTDDQTVINRNILKNKAQEEEEEKIQDNKSNYYCGGDSSNNNNNNVNGCEYAKNKGIFARSAKKSATLFNMYSLSSKSINATFLFNNNNMNNNSNSNNSKVTNIHLNSNRNNSFRRTHSKKNDLSINSSLSFKKKNMSFKSSAYYQ